MEHIEDKKVGDLAIENHAVLKLFLHYKIDFYCNGKLSLKEALLNSKIDKESFLKQLEKSINQPISNFEVRIEEWPLDLLADYIQKTHHKYTDQTLVDLKKRVNEYIENGFKNIEVVENFKIQLELLAKELGGHMKKEEFILFPFIRKMVATRGKMDAPKFESVKNPIEMMIHEHDTAFNLLKVIRGLLKDYKLIFDKDAELDNIVMLMRDLDQDLALHLHLENNILFPNVIELEKNKVVL